MEIVDRYVAIWNEADPAMRRRRIEAVWAADGASCFRLLNARGHDAIEGRVASSWEKWLTDGKYRFRRKSLICHHDAARCEWQLIRLEDGAVQAEGLSFLLLDPRGKIREDYQFNPTVDDAPDVTARYLAVLNEAASAARLPRVAALWADGAVAVSPEAVAGGHHEVDAGIERLRARVLGPGQAFLAMGRSQRHHNVARIAWSVRAGEAGHAATTATHLLIFDDNDRIARDYRFDDLN